MPLKTLVTRSGKGIHTQNNSGKKVYKNKFEKNTILWQDILGKKASKTQLRFNSPKSEVLGQLCWQICEALFKIKYNICIVLHKFDLCYFILLSLNDRSGTFLSYDN